MPKKIVLAYSGGLDTSVILKWLQVKYECPIVTFTADLGQGEELDPVKEKAKSLGVEEFFIEDLREEFVKNYVFPMFRANALYEGTYFLGTAIARPLIAKKQVEIAKEVGADFVAHGATGKGNDQVRFELGYYANNPKIEVISPWREWEFNSRNDLINFAEKYQIPDNLLALSVAKLLLALMQIYFTPHQKVKFLKTHGLMRPNIYIQELSQSKMLIQHQMKL